MLSIQFYHMYVFPQLYSLHLKEEYYIYKDIYKIIICNGEKTEKQRKCPTIKGN